VSILKRTKIYGKAEALLVNGSPDVSLATDSVKKVVADYAGFVGDNHYGETRASCVRVKAQFPEGTEIRNVRQISILSVEELAIVAERMGIPEVKPQWVGCNLLVSGIPDFTLVPPSSRLIFEGGVVLTIDMENGPCRYPGDVMEEFHPGCGKLFAPSAQNLRGVTAWVEKTGEIEVGETCRLHIPPQRIYSHA